MPRTRGVPHGTHHQNWTMRTEHSGRDRCSRRSERQAGNGWLAHRTTGPAGTSPRRDITTSTHVVQGHQHGGGDRGAQQRDREQPGCYGGTVELTGGCSAWHRGWRSRREVAPTAVGGRRRVRSAPPRGTRSRWRRPCPPRPRPAASRSRRPAGRPRPPQRSPPTSAPARPDRHGGRARPAARQPPGAGRLHPSPLRRQRATRRPAPADVPHRLWVRVGVEPGSDLQLPASGAQGGDDAAVHEQVGASDEAGVGAEEEGGGGGHFVGGADSAGSGGLDHLLVAPGGVPSLHCGGRSTSPARDEHAGAGQSLRSPCRSESEMFNPTTKRPGPVPPHETRSEMQLPPGLRRALARPLLAGAGL